MKQTHEQSRERSPGSKWNLTILAKAVVTVAVGAWPAWAAAHHSFAMYDQSQVKTVTGKLTRFIPGANHAQLIFELLESDGSPSSSGR